MEKSNLGICKFILGAAFYLLCLFSGYLAAILVGGYILIRETDEDLRTAAITGILVLLAGSVLNVVFGFFPDCISSLQETLFNMNMNFSLSGIYDIFAGIRDFINFLVDAFLAVLAVMMFIKKPLNLKFIKKFSA